MSTLQELLPDEEGLPEDVTDFRSYAYDVTRGVAYPRYFCVRLSWNAVQVK